MRAVAVLLVAALALASYADAKKTKEAFTAKTVQSIVEQEIMKKIPQVKGRKMHKLTDEERTSLNGVHLKEATDAINKLVDESIVDRVQEAEKEVSQMLLKSIEHHIQDAGKVLLRQDENTCTDKIASCQQLAEAGVCASSKDAMVINCPKTCNFCGILDALNHHHQPQKSHHEPSPPSHHHARHHTANKKSPKHHHHNDDDNDDTTDNSEDSNNENAAAETEPEVVAAAPTAAQKSNTLMDSLSKSIGAGIFKSVGKGLLNTGASAATGTKKMNILGTKRQTELSDTLYKFVDNLVKRRRLPERLGRTEATED